MEATLTKPQISLNEWQQIVSVLQEQIRRWSEEKGWVVTVSETQVMDVRP